ncbi:MAG: VacJ family lipoprotein [Candidatus Electrothrix aestuarii]|uniref:VacJ family lipoprotein n=1 Tax=Candidatus Electrothrix aestuarii TaxID=3062594 RepID=A0AAU8LY33_9BACT|nr:VacJ family lipoprotein [Candidatus Electrothrix aestuarii]WPD23433.1 MAG: VacJ family lipoprotein [Candidatus Electrothrix sp. GW3-3]
MKQIFLTFLISLLMISGNVPPAFSDVLSQADDEIDFLDDAYYDTSNEESRVNDPLEGINRAVFVFNDYVFLWILNPIATGYSEIVPADIRGAFANFFYNLQEPVRIINTLLQIRLSDTGTLLARFTINSIGGVAGLGDPAAMLGFQRVEANLGQTLGSWGVPDGFFLMAPLLGPTTLRDLSGRLADSFTLTYIYSWAATEQELTIAFAGEDVNGLSLHRGEYEKLKKMSVDPYTAFRSGFYQHREKK